MSNQERDKFIWEKKQDLFQDAEQPQENLLLPRCLHQSKQQ